MNKVLKLYKEREFAKLEAKYKENIEKEKSTDKYVSEFNELVNGFKVAMEELAHRANDETMVNCIDYTGYCLDIPYRISEEYIDNITRDVENDYELAQDSLNKYIEEIDAVLLLSDDSEYQVQVLKNYNILDKNGTFK